jgi:putative membrane protein
MTITACAAALGCGATLAQAVGGPNGPQNPPSPPAVTGAPAHADEPTAATPGTSASGAPTGVSRIDTQDFITQIAYANQAEIEAARYALAHSDSTDIKRFARRMIADHSKANGELKQIAAREGFSAPTGLAPSDEQALARLQVRRGAAFDVAYARSQQLDHMQVAAEFKRAEQNHELSPAIRRFARMTLPTLEDHLQMANRLLAAHPLANHSG